MTEAPARDPHRWDQEIAELERVVKYGEKRKAFLDSIRPHLETFCSDCEAIFVEDPRGQRIMRVLEAFAQRRDIDITELSAEEGMKLACRRGGFGDLVRFIALAATGRVDEVLKGP